MGKEADRWTRDGGLVPDDLIVRIVMAWIDTNGPRFLFDGFPRTVGQARSLDASLSKTGLSLDLVAILELPEDEIRSRVARRLTCTACGSTFSASLHGCAEGDPCPRCSVPLVRRPDDSEEALSERLRVYRENTLPVAEYYQTTRPEIVRRIRADRPGAEILREISHLVEEQLPSAR